jgi:heat shock protein HslJ
MNMKRNLLLLAVIALFGLGASSCKHLPIDPVDPIDTTTHRGHLLKGTAWKLMSITLDGNVSQQPVNEIFTLKFSDDTHAGGQAACNSYGADFKADASNISFSNIISTEAYCGERSLDQKFIQALQTATRYALKANSSLSISSASGTSLYFTPVNSTPPPPDFKGIVHFADFPVTDFLIDPYKFEAVRKVDETHIAVKVSYSGGCTEHDFMLFADKTIQPGNATDFVQMLVTHNAHGDMCNAYLTKELVFDIAPLLQKWHETPHSNDRLALQFSQSNIGTIIFTK